jgi:hypothetical protein
VCGINDHEHTYDEYLILFAKSGMTQVMLTMALPSYVGDGAAEVTLAVVLPTTTLT